jgi:hypothetical protein
MDKTEKAYDMVYICLNCHQKHYIRVKFGESAPKAPEGLICDYCGCSFWSHPFRPDDKRAA